MTSWFVWSGDVKPLWASLSAVLSRFDAEILDSAKSNAVLTLDRISARLEGSEGNFKDIPFRFRRRGVVQRGRLTLSQDRSRSCTFEIDLSLASDYAKSAFESAAELASFLSSTAEAVDAFAGQIQAQDFPDNVSSLKYEVFNSVDTTQVPVSIEWINAFRRDYVQRLGWSEAQPTVGRTTWDDNYLVIVLTSEPFSYAEMIGVEEQRVVEKELKLKELQGLYAWRQPRSAPS